MATSGYSVINSLSPMMFRKGKKKQDGGTRNERMRSKSVENLVDTMPPKHKQKRSGSSSHVGKHHSGQPWKEIALIKSTSPPITCILPSSSMDFVASALLAVGAVPLITEGMCMCVCIFLESRPLSAGMLIHKNNHT